jgi:hypothetical protein
MYKWLVRVKSEGELHSVTCYGRSEEEAKVLGERIAKQLLRDPELTVQWVKVHPRQT